MVIILVKKDLTKIVYSVSAILFLILSIVSLCFNHVLEVVKIDDTSTNYGVTFKDWSSILKEDNEYLTLWKVSKIFMIICLVTFGICIVLSALQLFVKHRVVKLLSMIGGISAIVLSVIYMIIFIWGGLLYSGYVSNMAGSPVDMKILFLPNVAPIFLSAFGIVGSSLLLISQKEIKA